MTAPVHFDEPVPRRLAPVTIQPDAASWSAQALPIPAEAPVTSATLLAEVAVLVGVAGLAGRVGGSTESVMSGNYADPGESATPGWSGRA
jgi:hypothetical protein